MKNEDFRNYNIRINIFISKIIKNQKLNYLYSKEWATNKHTKGKRKTTRSMALVLSLSGNAATLGNDVKTRRLERAQRNV